MKVLLIGAGCLALALGTVGIFIPVLPTVPFLLLASFCFLKSSARLHGWLLNHRVLGSHIRDYEQHRAVSRSVKIGGLIWLWVSLGIAMALVGNMHVRILLAAVGVAVSVHLLMLKMMK